MNFKDYFHESIGLAVCNSSFEYLWHSASWPQLFGKKEKSYIGESHFKFLETVPYAWEKDYNQVLSTSGYSVTYKPEWFNNQALLHSVSVLENNLILILCLNVSEVTRFKESLYKFQDCSMTGKAIFRKEGENFRIVYWNKYAATKNPGINLEGSILSNTFFSNARLELEEEKTFIDFCFEVLETQTSDLTEIKLEALEKYYLITLFPISETELGCEWFDISSKIEFFQKTQFELIHDNLTGLFNRKLLGSQSIEFDYILFLDLDNFKSVNDFYTHSVGDKLLQIVAQRISQVAKNQVAVRVSGDEFFILVKGKTEKEVFELAVEICSVLKQPYLIQSFIIKNVSCSCGIAKFSKDVDTTVRKADLAMYQSKALGKSDKEASGIPIWYEESMGDSHTRQHKLLKLLYQAIQKNAFDIVLQPFVNLQELNEENPKKTPKVGYEVLVRWNTPSGPIPPSEFIPIAEDHGYITAITLLVLSQACKACKEINRVSKYPLYLSVNVSGQDLSNKRLKDSIDMLLEESGLDYNLIKFEITESVIPSIQEAENTVQYLNSEGLKSLLDDFGTKGSSLTLMFSLSVEGIKIDRDFIINWTDSVQHIIGLGHSKGLSVVCEGVESLEIAQKLKRAKADIGQGFLFGMPLSLEDTIEELLENEENN
jgi:diguanylate cyclase (GGDEF)-like protein